jgi:RNA polymerase sigma factor (TIGR02999 family)
MEIGCSRSLDRGPLTNRRIGDLPARLLPPVYDELRRVAGARLARLGPGQTLTPTDLVHEVYLRISDRHPEGLDGRRHLFFVASRAMRDILVESARRKASRKHGGEHRRGGDVTEAIAGGDRPMSLLELNFALKKLERESPERAQVVLLRYFGGFTHAEIAEVLGLSLATVERRWAYCRAWLRREILEDSKPYPGHGPAGRRHATC